MALAALTGAIALAAAASGAAAQKSGLPQLNFPDFAPQLIWLVLTFGALYLLMSRVALPRIGDVIEERRQRIERDLAEAERLKGETDKALAAYEGALADAKSKAGAIAKETRESLARETDQERQAVEKEIGAKLADAEKRINETKQRALGQVNEVAGDTAGAIVEKLIGRSIAAAEVQRALLPAGKA
jgi:F-type H+-transporting ATPase subunit b